MAEETGSKAMGGARASSCPECIFGFLEKQCSDGYARCVVSWSSGLDVLEPREIPLLALWHAHQQYVFKMHLRAGEMAQ